MSRSVVYNITAADVAEASEIAMAGVAAAKGLRPLVLSLAALVMGEIARTCSDATPEEGDRLAADLLRRFRAKNGEAQIRQMLEIIQAQASKGAPS